MDSSVVGGISPCTPMTVVGFRHDLPQPECMVSHCGISLKEGWKSTFLHRLLLSQHLHKEGPLSIAKNPRGTWKSGQCRPLSMPGPEVKILADQDGWAVKAIHCIYCWQPGFLHEWLHVFWAVQCTNHIPAVNAELPWGAESNILPHLPR